MISIIVPTLNEGHYIADLLDSIVAQDFPESIELVIADAHSTDNTLSVIERYRPKFQNLHIVEGGLPAKARNNGARVATGEILLFIDADITLPSPLFLKKNVDYFRSRSLAVASALFTPRSTRVADHLLTSACNVAVRILKYIRPHGSMCVMVTRDIFLKSGGYPEDRVLAEDHDFIQRCTRFGSFDQLPIYAEFSVRRFEKEGRFGIAWKYTVATLHLLFLGPITKPIFKYDFKYSE